MNSGSAAVRKNDQLIPLVAALALIPLSPAQAQERPQERPQDRPVAMSDAEQAILIAGAEFIRQGMVESGALSEDHDLVVDPVVLEATAQNPPAARRAAATWHGRDLAAVADALGGQAGRLEAHHSCRRSAVPGDCSISGVDAVFSFGLPEVQGDSARLQIRAIHRSIAAPDPDRAYRAAATLILRERGNGWEVARVERRSVN